MTGKSSCFGDEARSTEATREKGTSSDSGLLYKLVVISYSEWNELTRRGICALAMPPNRHLASRWHLGPQHGYIRRSLAEAHPQRKSRGFDWPTSREWEKDEREEFCGFCRGYDGKVRGETHHLASIATVVGKGKDHSCWLWRYHLPLRVLSLLRNRLCQILVDLSGVSWEFHFVCPFLPWDLGCAHFVDFTYEQSIRGQCQGKSRSNFMCGSASGYGKWQSLRFYKIKILMKRLIICVSKLSLLHPRPNFPNHLGRVS